MEEVKRNEIGCRINVQGHSIYGSDFPQPATLYKDGTVIPMKKFLVETIEHDDYIEEVFEWQNNPEETFYTKPII